MNSYTPSTLKRTKIVATVGPATDSYEKILGMVKAGVDVFRLNFSHGTNEERDRQIPWIRKASEKVGRPVAIVEDLQGPKIRLGDFEGTVDVKAGQDLSLVYGRPAKSANELPVQYDLSAKMKPGERLFLYDGKVRSKVTHTGDGVVTVRIENDGTLLKRKGVNVPDTNFGGDVLTEKDLKDIAYGAARDFDYVAMSFVQTAADVDKLRELLQQHKFNAKIIVKIETQAAIEDENLEAIIQAADAAMVARGDLATETSPEIVPIIQRRILKLTQKHGKASIVATQMMASMQHSPEPTRAEVNDVATAVITGSDAVMLSDETAMGDFPLEAVSIMRRVITLTQKFEPATPLFYRENDTSIQDAISSAAMTLAHQVGAKAIICETKTGSTTRSIASHRPSMPIISVTSDARVADQLCLVYATTNYIRPDGEHNGLDVAKELCKAGFFTAGDIVVLVSGRQPGLTGGTDTIRVRVLE